MALLFPVPRIQFFDNNGVPLVGGLVYTYEAGTTNLKTTWKDEAETVPNTNPVVLDSIRGDAVIRGKGSYKIVLHDANDVLIPGYIEDNITLYDLRDWSGLTASIADLNATDTSTITKTADYPIILTDRGKTILVDATAATPTTVTLLNATTAGNGYQITIKKIDKTNNVVDIDAATAQLIDGIDPFVLYDYNDFVKVLSDGSNWHLIAAKIRGTVISTTTTPLAPTLSDELKTYIIDASSGAFTVNLPAINTLARGYRIGFKKLDSSSNAITINANGSEQIDGSSSVVLAKQFDFINLVNDGSNWFVIGEYGSESSDALPARYIAGLYTSPDSGDPDHDIEFGTGECRDEDDTMNINLTSAIVKRIDANWVAGTGNGGFPSALTLTADTWYHLFDIAKPDGVVDAGFDSDISATNLLSDATGYTGYRRVASVLTDASSNITSYRQGVLNNDLFYWNGRTQDFLDTNPGTAIQNKTIRVPPGVEVYAILGFRLQYSVNTAGSTILNVLSEGVDEDTTGAQLESKTFGLSESIPVRTQIHVLTNSIQELKYMLSASITDTTVQAWTHGWIDPRGK